MKRERLLVNGEAMDFPEGEFPATIAELAAVMGLDINMVVVEINGDIVKRDQTASRKLEPGDTIELVKFVGGG